MPHKHKRRLGEDPEEFNLPPNARAKPLPVYTSKNQQVPVPAPKRRKVATKTPGNNQYGADDTPKAFQRLMAFSVGKGYKGGLDDGMPKTKKAKKKTTAERRAVRDAAAAGAGGADGGEAEDIAETAPKSEAQPVLKIQPGESMSDFNQRVNAALPLSGIQKNTKKVDGAPDRRITKHEKHLKRLQAGWREEEARIRDREAEALELAEEEQDELDAMWEDKTADLPTSGRMGKKSGNRLLKRRKRAGEVDIKEEDPWEALKKKRNAAPKGLHDVVQEPPTFTKVPREIFKVKNGARVNVGNIPNAVGSLAKREQLGEERQTIIDTYRRLMAAKKEGADK